MQWAWRYGKEITKPLDPVSVGEFYKDRTWREWHHSLVRLPPTPEEQERLKVRTFVSSSRVDRLWSVLSTSS